MRTIISEGTKIERKKISIDQPTYEKLKNFSRLKGLKLRLVVDAMVDLLLQDEQLGKRVVDLTVERESQEEY